VSEETRNSENNTPCTAKYGRSLHFCSAFFSVIPKPPIRGEKIGEKKTEQTRYTVKRKIAMPRKSPAKQNTDDSNLH